MERYNWYFSLESYVTKFYLLYSEYFPLLKASLELQGTVHSLVLLVLQDTHFFVTIWYMYQNDAYFMHIREARTWMKVE